MTLRDTEAGQRSRSGRAPRRMAPAQRREHLINTALQLYRHRPPEDVSIDDIVTEADVSRALFYRYFSNITDVHVAALSSVVDELTHRLTLAADDGDLTGQLRNALTEFITFVHTYASSYVALLRSGSTIATNNTDSLVDRVRDHVIDLVLDRLQLTEHTPMLRMTLRGWVSLVETTLLSWLQDPTPAREQLENWLVDQLFAMAAATAQHDPRLAEQLGDLLESAERPSGRG